MLLRPCVHYQVCDVSRDLTPAAVSTLATLVYQCPTADNDCRVHPLKPPQKRNA
jgi:hypothetical protein